MTLILQAVTLLVVTGNTADNDVEDNDEKDDDPSDGNNCYPLLVDNDVDHNSEDDADDDDDDDLSGVHPNSHKHFILYMGFCASIWDSVRHHCHHHHHHHDHQK